MVPATFLGAGQKKETSLVQISQFLKSFKITTRLGIPFHKFKMFETVAFDLPLMVALV